MKCSLSNCSITHGHKCYVIGSVVLFSESNTSSHGNLCTYDSVSTHEVFFFVKKVHGSTLSFGTTCCSSVKFRHQDTWICSKCNWVRVIAVSCHVFVSWLTSACCPCNNGFLSNVKVTESTKFLLNVQLTSFLFETTN